MFRTLVTVIYASFYLLAVGLWTAVLVQAAEGVDAIAWPAWIQAIGSVLAILAAIWISNTRQAAEDRERKLKARSLALAIVPELVEIAVKVKAAGAGGAVDAIRIAKIDIPPVLSDSVDRLYLLGEVGGEIQQLVAYMRQFNRMVDQGWPGGMANDHEAIAAVRAALAPRLKMADEAVAEALETIGPIHDGKV